MSLFGKAKVDKVDLKKRFHLLGTIGQGSMSKVWRAEDKVDGRSIAVKVLDKDKTRKFENRFQGLNKPPEQDIAAQLRHPYIVQTLETGISTDDEVFLVMEFVEGSGLSLLVDLQSDEMHRYRIRYMIQIGEALAYFHQQQWIHRDLCPRNIMITDKNNIKLIDFGLTVPNTPDFQKPGNRTGTANYLAPELIKRHSTDQRLDVFSYAVTCYEMYTKRHPWASAVTLDAVMQHINNPPIPILELIPDVNPRIAEIIMKGLESDRDARWSTAQEMVDAFRDIEPELIQQTKAWFKSTGKPLPGSKEQKKAARAKTKRSPTRPMPESASPVAAASQSKKRRRRMDSDDDIAAAFLADDDDDSVSFTPDHARDASVSPKAKRNKRQSPPSAAKQEPEVESSTMDDGDDILALPED